MPAPATRPRFQPRLKPSGGRLAERGERLRGEPVHLERLLVAQPASSPTWRAGATISARTRTGTCSSTRTRACRGDDEPFLVVAVEREAEHAAGLLVGRLYVLESPRRPQLPRHARIQAAVDRRGATGRKNRVERLRRKVVMRFRGLMVIVALALVVAAPAGGRVLDVGFLDDPAGDGTPDITRLRVGSNATAVTFIVDLANQTTLGGRSGDPHLRSTPT